MQKILLIDDDDEIRRVAAKFLRKHGFEVVIAPDGERGLPLAKEHLPDLIICDLMMTGMDGYEVLATLRRDAKTASIPVIFLTGLSEPHQVRHGMNLGADDYLTKPIVSKDLLAAVHARLERSGAERQRQEQQMERAMQLFAGIIHDLRDPLFVVFGYTDLLKSANTPNDSAADGSQILDRMQTAIVRMQDIIAETLFLAKSRMQRLPFDPGSFDLRVFCAQLLADHECGQRLRFECVEGSFPVVADPLRLRQAMENLLSNALKYSEHPVVVRLSRRAAHYQIEVRDTGIGIPKEDQASLFDPFFRASNAKSRPGNGLGLCIVKSCVEQHGGTVEFTSQLNEGTVFTLILPERPTTSVLPAPSAGSGTPPSAARAAEPALPAKAPTPQASVASPATRAKGAVSPAPNGAEGTRLRTIIVDDDPLVRGLLRDILESTVGVEVVGEAGSVADARFLARQHNPNLVLLDVNLPDALGFELLADLKPEVEVIFVTSAEEYAVNAFDCEAADYLLKPVSRERLTRALERVRGRLPAPAAPTASAKANLADSFLVKTLSEKTLIKIGDIRSVVAYGEYSWVYWNAEKGALLRKSLKKWLSELPPSHFIRVHRHSIVNLAHLERVERMPNGRMQVHLRGSDKPVEVSLRLAPSLNRKLRAFRA